VRRRYRKKDSPGVKFIAGVIAVGIMGIIAMYSIGFVLIIFAVYCAYKIIAKIFIAVQTRNQVYLVFDTETTGLPKTRNAPVSDLDNWPRLVQIAWVLVNNDGQELSSAEHIIKPSGFIIPVGASRIHGITTTIAKKSGKEIKPVLEEFIEALGKADVLIAHNMQFDGKVVGAELLRMGYPNYIERKKQKCTMRETKNYCKLQGRFGYKFPTLQELYVKLFGQTFSGEHSALVDVRACSKCYFELKRTGVV